MLGIKKSFITLGPGSQGGYSDISYIRRLGPFFLVQNFEFQYLFVFSEKLIFFEV